MAQKKVLPMRYNYQEGTPGTCGTNVAFVGVMDLLSKQGMGVHHPDLIKQFAPKATQDIKEQKNIIQDCKRSLVKSQRKIIILEMLSLLVAIIIRFRKW